MKGKIFAMFAVFAIVAMAFGTMAVHAEGKPVVDPGKDGRIRVIRELVYIVYFEFQDPLTGKWLTSGAWFWHIRVYIDDQLIFDVYIHAFPPDAPGFEVRLGTQQLYTSEGFVVEDHIGTINTVIKAVPDKMFKNPNNADNLKNALSNKLDAIQSMIDAGNYNEAVEKLQNDVRAKMDGSVDGNSNNDWIVDSFAQGLLCDMIDTEIGYLTA